MGKMAGGSNDPDDLIVRAFKAYETDGKIEAEMFRHALMNFGDKFNQAEIDDIFGEFEVDDDGFLESKAVIGLFVAGGGEEKRKKRRRKRPHLQKLLRKKEPRKRVAARRKRRRRRLPSKHSNKILLLNFTYTDTKCLLLSVWFLRQWSFLDSHLSDLITESRTGFLT